MARAIIVTIGVSLIQDHVLDREGLGVGFEALPSPALNLGQLDKELGKADDRHARPTGVAFNPEEGLWVRTRATMVTALDRIATDPILTLTPLQRQQYLGAELASLKCLGRDKPAAGSEAEPPAAQPWERPLAADDAVTLLASDTAPGIFCAGVIQEVLRDGRAGFPKVANVVIAIATGLRPESRELFLASGLPSAAESLYQARRKHPETLLIGSGGYKGLLPYLLPVAMHLGVPILYLYEESEELLTIQPLPTTLNLNLITCNESAFDRLAPALGETRRVSCREALFWTPIRKRHPEDEEQILARGWVEPADDPAEIQLSPTGVLAWLLAYHGRRPARPVDPEPLRA